MGKHKKTKKFKPNYVVVERWADADDKEKWFAIAQFVYYFDAVAYLNALKRNGGEDEPVERKVKEIKR